MNTGRSASISVIIPNYNYQNYVGQAIESALSLKAASIEIIVVDDGSTDKSIEVIESYSDRGVKLIRQNNAGQAAACDRGFSESTGELVIFLDSDDFLDPSFVSRALAESRPGVSKYQFQMKAVDTEGRSLGNIFPLYNGTPTSPQIRKWYFTSSAYPTPPGSGNIYTREFLTKISPLEYGDDRAADSYYLAAAPILGDIITIPEPLASYRVHDTNSSAMSSLRPEVFSKDLKRAMSRNAYAAGVAQRNGVNYRSDNIFKSLKVLSLRICSFVLTRDTHPIEKDSQMRILKDCAVAVFVPQGNSFVAQFIACIWIALVATLPLSLGKHLVTWRFVPALRPSIIKKLIKRV